MLTRFILDIFNSSELVFFYTSLVYSITTQNTYTLFIFLSFIAKTLIIGYPKKYFKNSKLGKRPEGAFNCNAFSCGGESKTGGLFSGHMINVTMLMTLILLNVLEDKKFDNQILAVILFVILSTSVGRYFTNCHTLFQICVGLIIGILFGYLLFKLQKVVEKYKRFKEDKEKVYKCLETCL